MVTTRTTLKICACGIATPNTVLPSSAWTSTRTVTTAIGDGNYDKFEVDDYLACTQADFNDNNGYSYYIGPYCASQGGAMDMFSDESCSSFAASAGGLETFAGLTGQELLFVQGTPGQQQ
jgi:putative hemolysin